MRNVFHGAVAGAAISLFVPAWAGVHNVKLDTSPDRQRTGLHVDMKRIGTIAQRSVYDIEGSRFSIGCEILDRDFANFWEYAEFLEPLGIRSVRLQSGWAKTERERGVFDFKWLDDLVNFFAKRGYTIMIEPGYCNPIYNCGGLAGGWDLGTGFPRTEEGLKAWDNYVTRLVNRYKDRVHDWSMWNEASNLWEMKGRPEYATPEETAEFCRHTANLILDLQPEARIACFALGSDASLDAKGRFLDRAFKVMGEDLKRYTWVIVHGYCWAPEKAQPGIDKIRELIAKYAPNLKLRQGEQGCPSELVTRFALPNCSWSEISQAKWFMRRMLFDLGNDMDSHVYTISDFNHKGVLVDQINNKGLIRANWEKETVAVKRAYYAVQNTVSVFDNTLSLVKDAAITNMDYTIKFNEYRKPDGRPVYVFWKLGEGPNTWREEIIYERPRDSFETQPTVFKGHVKPLENPVWVDLFSGRIYEFPKRDVLVGSKSVMYVNVPVYDSPCLLTERSVVIDDVRPSKTPILEIFEKTRREASTHKDMGAKAKVVEAAGEASKVRRAGSDF